jgi:hypothetical protein
MDYSVGMGLNVIAVSEARKINLVIPAKAEIHAMCHMALCYGFPLSRE